MRCGRPSAHRYRLSSRTSSSSDTSRALQLIIVPPCSLSNRWTPRKTIAGDLSGRRAPAQLVAAAGIEAVRQRVDQLELVRFLGDIHRVAGLGGEIDLAIAGQRHRRLVRFAD